MQVFHQLDQIESKASPSVVAIGNFDGVHLGHAALLSHMLSYARSSGLVGSVLTFYPHPVEVLNPAKKLLRLTTTSEKLALMEKMGVDLVLVEKFTPGLASLSPDEFFERYLVKGLNAKSVHVGFDFSFGKGRAGNTKVLKELATRRGIHVAVEEAQISGQMKISSSAIRESLAQGDVSMALKLLGRPYSVYGQVGRGDNRGAGLGFPTANIRYPAEKALPKHGVYVTRALWQKQSFRSVTNVGLRPTFQAEAEPTVEVHILDFNARLYDEFVEVAFLERIRDEKKFESVDQLKKQIEADLAYVRKSKLF